MSFSSLHVLELFILPTSDAASDKNFLPNDEISVSAYRSTTQITN